jgi:UTP--glucose-1-phosphate uridylyltransferase
MAKIARESGVYALEFEGDRYDLGSKFGFLKANIVKGLTHPETAESLKEFIKEIAKEL